MEQITLKLNAEKALQFQEFLTKLEVHYSKQSLEDLIHSLKQKHKKFNENSSLNPENISNNDYNDGFSAAYLEIIDHLIYTKNYDSKR